MIVNVIRGPGRNSSVTVTGIYGEDRIENDTQSTPKQIPPPIDHVHGPFGCTCCGIRDKSLTEKECEPMWELKSYMMYEQMITRIEPVHGTTKRCLTIASIKDDISEDDNTNNTNPSNDDHDNGSPSEENDRDDTDSNHNTSDNQSFGTGYENNNSSSTTNGSLDDTGMNGSTDRNNTQLNRCPGGRPNGTTNHSKRQLSVLTKAAMFRICCRFEHEKDFHLRKKGFKLKLFKRICEQERVKLGLDDSFKFEYKAAMARIRRSSLDGCNRQSPLIFIEDKIVELVLCMSNIKRSLSVSEGLSLVNELIVDTKLQDRLIDWKLKNNIFYSCKEELGKVGVGYWHRFLKRNRHRLRSKKGRKFGCNRSNYSSYLNFMDMYEHIMDVLVNTSKIGRKIDQAVWMTKDGEVVTDEMKGYGCKVDMILERPDMGIVMDEVGCNLSQEMDNLVGGQRYLTSVEGEAAETSATRNHHFTCLGLTRLDGEPLMCVVIIAGKNHDLMVECGIDWTKLNDIDMESNSQKTNSQFVRDNYGENRLLPGAPNCQFKGKTVPAFVTFTEGGGMNGWVLTEILRRIDDLELYHQDRMNGLTPFLLLDGHQSRFDLRFLKYINEKETQWSVCLGVPYGTALWQVADSSEQNGMFKMELTKMKKRLYNNRVDGLQHSLHLTKTDIIPLVHHCWPIAYANVRNNRKAIAERGWNPFNRVLLLEPTLRAKMTEHMIMKEMEQDRFPTLRMPELFKIYYSMNNAGITISSQDSVSKGSIDTSLNFNGGVTAKYVSNSIMTEVDRQEARERNQRNREEGTTARERLRAITSRMTAGKLTSEGRHYHLNSAVVEHVEQQDNDSSEVLREKRRLDDLRYLKSCYIADKVLVKNKDTELPYWKNAGDLLKYLRPLKTEKEDGSMPTKRPELQAKYMLWRLRSRKHIIPDRVVLEKYENWIESQSAKTRGN